MARVPKVVASAVALPAAAKATASRAVSVDDRELVRRAQAEEQEAFEELVRRHQQRVTAVAGGILRQREDVEVRRTTGILECYEMTGALHAAVNAA